MSKYCCNLSLLPKVVVQEWLGKFEALLVDGDGVLWHFHKPLRGASKTFNALRANGKRMFLCTNSSKRSTAGIREHIKKVGMQLKQDEILSAPISIASYLRKIKFNKTAYVVGIQGFVDELKAAGITTLPIGPDPITSLVPKYIQTLKLEENVGAVIVGSDDYLSVPKIIKAASYLIDPNCLFLATSTGTGFPAGKFLVPGAGSAVLAIRTCSYRQPLILGKPNPIMCARLIAKGIIKPETTLMIGDSLYTDVVFGNKCGFKTMLVGTGISKLEDVDKVQKSDNRRKHLMIPDAYLPSFADLINYIPRCE